MKCPVCNCEISLPEKGERKKCPFCGSVIENNKEAGIIALDDGRIPVGKRLHLQRA